MSSVPERPPKRRRDEIEEEIEDLSKVISTMSGSKKSFLQAKLCNIKLKKQKLIALSFCRSHEPSKRNLVTEYDIMIAENDLDIEIESIRSSKKFKRTEERYLERLFRDPFTRVNRNFNFTPNEASTSDNTSAEIPSPSNDNTPLNCREKQLNTQNRPMCDKSTNTEPVYILRVPNAKEVMSLDANESSSDITMLTVEENVLSNQSMPPFEDSLSPIGGSVSPMEGNVSPLEGNVSSLEVNVSPLEVNVLPLEVNVSPLEVNVSPMEVNVSCTEVILSPMEEKKSVILGNESHFKENLMPTGEYTFLQSSEHGFIQSKWFESSFEMDHFLNEKPEVAQKSEKCSSTDYELTKKDHKHNYYQRKSKKSHKAKKSALSQTSKEIITGQNLTVDSTTVPMSGKKNTTNVALSAAALEFTSTPMVLPEATVSLPEVTVALPDSTIGAMSEARSVVTERAKTKIALPKSTVTLPEGNHSHRLIVNLFGTYKEIYSSQKVANNSVNKHSGQKDINNNDDGKKLLAKHDLKMAAICDDKSNTEILQKSKNSTKKAKKHYSKNMRKDVASKPQDPFAKFEDWSTKSQDTPAKSKDLSTKSQDLPAKYKDLSTKSQYLPAKSNDLSTKSQYLPAKSKDLSTKSQYLPAKSKDLSTNSQYLPAKSKDLSIKSQDLSSKYKALSTKSQYLPAKSIDLSTKSQYLPAKSKDLSTKSQYLPAKSKEMSIKSQDLPAKCKDSYTKSKGLYTKKSHKTSKERSEEKLKGQKSSSSNTFSQEKALLHVRELFKIAMEKNAVTISQEDLVNDLFRDLMASKQVKPGTDSSPEKTVSCQTCGLVYEGHMCAHTIREILERC